MVGTLDVGPQVDRDVVLRVMRESLKRFANWEGHPPYYSQLMNATLERLAHSGHVDGRYAGQDGFSILGADRQRQGLLVLLTECYQRLLTLGYVVPLPQPPGPPKHDWFMVTDHGKAWATGADAVPEDQKGFLRALETLVPEVDGVIKQYVQEALIAYDRQAYFAAAVMIGAASEKAIYTLVDALVPAITDDAPRKALLDAVDRRRLFSMLELMREQLQRARAAGVIPFAVHEGADAHMLSLQEAIRVQRNEAVHPQAGQVTPIAVRLSLSAFPTACRKVYDVLAWLKANKIPKP